MVKNKEGSFRIVAIFFFLTMIIAFNWEKWTWLKNGVNYVLEPTIGTLLNWNTTIGMLIVILVLSILMTIVQKYTTNQEELRKIKKIQKELQTKQKEHKNDPKKSMEIQKEIMTLMPKQMKLGMRTIVYTGIPFVLLFRWFNDYFATFTESIKFFGFLNWFWFYLIFTLIFSSFLRKKFNVV